MRNTVLSLAALGALGAFVLWPAADESSEARAGGAVTVAEAQMIDRLREMARPPAAIVTDDLLIPARLEAAVPATAPIADAATETLVVLPDALNLRSTPSREGDILARLLHGEAVEVSDRRDGWVQVANADGIVGWANADFLAAAH